MASLRPIRADEPGEGERVRERRGERPRGGAGPHPPPRNSPAQRLVAERGVRVRADHWSDGFALHPVDVLAWQPSFGGFSTVDGLVGRDEGDGSPAPDQRAAVVLAGQPQGAGQSTRPTGQVPRTHVAAALSSGLIAALPDVPTAREVGLSALTLEFWAGVLAPAGTPQDVVGKLNAAINETLASDEMKAAMGKLGFDAKIGSPQDFTKFIAEETPRWTEIVKQTGVKAQ